VPLHILFLPLHTPICHHSLLSVIVVFHVPSLSPLYHCTFFPFCHHNLQLINQWIDVTTLM
jgi:hypothetical protein